MEAFFEYCNKYVKSDEDYEDRITILEDGELTVFHSETYCWKPDTITKTRFGRPQFLEEINNILNTYKTEIENLPEIEISTQYYSDEIRIWNKHIAGDLFNKYTFLSEIVVKVKETIKTNFPDIYDDK